MYLYFTISIDANILETMRRTRFPCIERHFFVMYSS